MLEPRGGWVHTPMKARRPPISPPIMLNTVNSAHPQRTIMIRITKPIHLSLRWFRQERDFPVRRDIELNRLAASLVLDIETFNTHMQQT